MLLPKGDESNRDVEKQLSAKNHFGRSISTSSSRAWAPGTESRADGLDVKPRDVECHFPAFASA